MLTALAGLAARRAQSGFHSNCEPNPTLALRGTYPHGSFSNGNANLENIASNWVFLS
jgi:hypothetical protein